MSWFSKDVSEDAKRSITEVVTAAVREALEKSSSRLKEAMRLGDNIETLKRQVADLEIQKAKKEEEFAKREREVEHMVGLERKRSEFEKEAAKREAVLDVREANLTAERERFEKQMEFQNNRFTEEVGYLKKMIGQVLTAIPNVGTDAPARRR